MIEFLYNFIFGSGFASVLESLGLSEDMVFSVFVLAHVECCVAAVFVFGSVIHFFISIFRRKRRVTL